MLEARLGAAELRGKWVMMSPEMAGDEPVLGRVMQQVARPDSADADGLKVIV